MIYGTIVKSKEEVNYLISIGVMEARDWYSKISLYGRFIYYYEMDGTPYDGWDTIHHNSCIDLYPDSYKLKQIHLKKIYLGGE